MEIPGRGRLSALDPLPDVATLAETLARGLPLQVSICTHCGQLLIPALVLTATLDATALDLGHARVLHGCHKPDRSGDCDCVHAMCCFQDAGAQELNCADGKVLTCHCACRTSPTHSSAPAWEQSQHTTPSTPSSALAQVRSNHLPQGPRIPSLQHLVMFLLMPHQQTKPASPTQPAAKPRCSQNLCAANAEIKVLTSKSPCRPASSGILPSGCVTSTPVRSGCGPAICCARPGSCWGGVYGRRAGKAARLARPASRAGHAGEGLT